MMWAFRPSGARPTVQARRCRRSPTPLHGPSAGATAAERCRFRGSLADARRPCRSAASLQEHHENRQDLVVTDTNPKQSVHIYKCRSCTIRVEGKVNEILLGTRPAGPLRQGPNCAHRPARSRPWPREAQTTASASGSYLTTSLAAWTLSTRRTARPRSRASRRPLWCVPSSRLALSAQRSGPVRSGVAWRRPLRSTRARASRSTCSRRRPRARRSSRPARWRSTS